MRRGPILSAALFMIASSFAVGAARLCYAAPPVPAPASPPTTPAVKPPAVPSRPLAAITALSFSPDGKSLAVGTYGQAIVFDATNWQPGTTIRRVEDCVRAIAWSPDSKTLAVASGLAARDGLIQLWDASGTQPPVTLVHQHDTIEAVAFNADGKQLLIGANDNKARWYNALPSEFGPLLDEHNGRVTACAFSSKPGFVFVTGGMDKIVKVWDETLKSVVINFDQCAAGVSGLAFLPNGTQFVGSSLDGKLHWWQIDYNDRRRTYTGSNYRQTNAHDGPIYAFAMAANGKRMATGGEDNHVKVWNAENGGGERDFKEAAQPIYAAALSTDGKTLAAGGRDGLIRIYDVDGNKLITTITPPPLPKPAKRVRKPMSRSKSAHAHQAQK